MSADLLMNVAVAYKALRSAEEAFVAAVKSAYPVGAEVRIHERRGVTYAVVIGHAYDGRLIARNTRTGKQRRFGVGGSFSRAIDVISRPEGSR